MTKALQRLVLLLALCCMPWLLGTEVVRAQAVPSPRGASVSEPAGAASNDPRETLAALEMESKPKRQFALFRTAALDPKLQELGAALDPVVLSELNTIGSIEVAARPSLYLPAMQLAIDCAGEIVIACFVIVFNLIVDILYAWLDPRVRYD